MCFLIGSFIVELNVITKDYNTSSKIIDFSAFETSGYNPKIDSNEFQIELNYLKNSLDESNIHLIQYNEGLKFIRNFTWALELINIYPYTNYFKFIFMQNMSTFIERNNNSSSPSDLSLYEGRYPEFMNEVIVNIRFKEKGYNLNDNLTFQYYYDEKDRFPYDGSQDSSHLENITIQIVGFYKINSIEFLKSIDTTSYDIKYQYILGSSSLGLNFYHKANLIMINTSDGIIPIQSKIVIFENQNKHQKYSDILRRSEIIFNWFDSLSRKGYSFNYGIDLSEIGLNAEKLYVFNQNVLLLRLQKTEISFIIIPFLIIFGFIGKFCSEQLMSKNRLEFHKLHCLGYDFKSLKRIFPFYISLQLFIGTLLSIFLLYEGLTLIPIYGEMLIEWVFFILIKFLIFYIIFNFFILYETCYKFLLKLIDEDYPNTSPEEEKYQKYQNELIKRRKRRIIRSLLVYSIFSILFFLLLNFSFNRSLTIVMWLGANLRFLSYIGILLIPLIIILPYLASKVIIPYFSKILTKILGIFQKLKKKKSPLMNVYFLNIQNNQIYQNISIIILVICLTSISLSTVFLRIDYEYQSSKYQLTWNNTSYRIDLSAGMSSEAENLFSISSDIQGFSGIRDSTEIFYGPIMYTKPDGGDQQLMGTSINPQSYLDFIDNGKIRFRNIVIDKAKIFNQLDDKKIIISKIFADAYHLNEGDIITFKKIDFQIDAIIESAPLLSVDARPYYIHVIFSSKYQEIFIDSTLKIYLQTDNDFNFNDYCNFLTVRYNYILDSITKAPIKFQYKPYFLAKFILTESILLVVSGFFFQVVIFKEIQNFRRKDHEIFFIHGINRSKLYKMMVKELYGFQIIIIGLSCILYFFLGFFIFNFIKFFINLQFEFPVYGGLQYFIHEMSWSKGLRLSGIGNPYTISYHFFTLEVFILILIQFFLLKIYEIHLKRISSKKNVIL